jgi:hypothetical protein
MSSIIKAKKDVFSNISVFSSLKEIDLKPNNSFDSITSIDNSKDIVPFLLDLSTSLVGSDGLENKLGLLFTQFISDYNNKSKDLLKSQFIGVNSDQTLPSFFVNDGINIPINKLDDFGDLKTPKNDPLGEILYDDNSDNLITKLKDGIISPNTVINYSNLNFTYNEGTQLVNVKPNSSTTVSSFILGYIDNFSPLNVKEIVADVLNSVYGTKTKQQNKTLLEILSQVEIDFIIDKLISDDLISLDDNDKIKLGEISDEIFKGFNEIDLGCGFIINDLSIEDLVNISNGISDSNDPSLINEEFTDLFLNSLDETTEESNKTKLKDSFIKRIINALKTRIIKDILFSPEKKLLFYINQFIQNNEPIDFNKNSFDFVNDNINLIKCITDEVRSLFIEFIFNLVKTEILEITKPALQKIIKEKINNYNIILRSLISK